MRATVALLALSAVLSAIPSAYATPHRTPVGADADGNASGSIPPWTGGMTAPPPGWQREQGYIDPFAAEKPIATVTARNLGAYKDSLAEGLQALLERNPDFRLPVYPSHRTAAFPASVLAHVGKGPGIIYPDPKTGLEAITNHLLRYLGGGIERDFDSFVVRASGDTAKIGFHDRRVYDANFDQPMPDRMFSYLGYFLSPADLVGTIYLVHEFSPLSDERRKAWIYNDGQRRVRRAPDLAYDSVQNGSDGLAIVDQYDGYNGSPDRYDWKLLGKRELLVPYNDYHIGDKRIPYSRIVLKGAPNPDLLRFELHRVWVVEARLKSGTSHVYARRVFYLDEDSWSVLLSEAWDSRGQLWRVGLHALVEYYDAQVPWYRFEAWFDLTNGSYVLTGLDNEYRTPWQFGIRGRMRDFDPDALRRMGH